MMSAIRWEVSPDYPAGRAVAMTPAEVALRDKDAAVAAAADTAARVIATNEATLRTGADQALANLEAAATNWATLTAAQKDDATRLAVRALARLVRLVVRHLDAAP